MRFNHGIVTRYVYKRATAAVVVPKRNLEGFSAAYFQDEMAPVQSSPQLSKLSLFNIPSGRSTSATADVLVIKSQNASPMTFAGLDPLELNKKYQFLRIHQTLSNQLRRAQWEIHHNGQIHQQAKPLASSSNFLFDPPINSSTLVTPQWYSQV